MPRRPVIREPETSEKIEAWRKMQLLLPEKAVEGLALWHGGQNTATYRLMSIGMRNLVSPAMIYDAENELDRTLSRTRGKHRKELQGLLADLASVRIFWHEHIGAEEDEEVDVDDAVYDFDDDEAEELLGN